MLSVVAVPGVACLIASDSSIAWLEWSFSPWLAGAMSLLLAVVVYPLWRVWKLKVPDRVRVSADVVELRSSGRTLSWPTELVTWVGLEGDQLRVEAQAAKVVLSGFDARALQELRSALEQGEDARPADPADRAGGISLGESIKIGVLAGVFEIYPVAEGSDWIPPPGEHHETFGARLRSESPRGWRWREWARVLGLSLVGGGVGAGVGAGLGFALKTSDPVAVFLGAAIGVLAILLKSKKEPYPREVVLYEHGLVLVFRSHWFALTQVRSMTRVWQGVRVRTSYRDACDLGGLSEPFVAEAERVLVSERAGRPT